MTYLEHTSFDKQKQDAREAMRVVFFLYSQNVFVCTKQNYLKFSEKTSVSNVNVSNDNFRLS